MKAITLSQPWASLVAAGAKRLETRSWSTRYRGQLAIHAARRLPREAAAICRREPFASALAGRELPLGVVLAVARLEDCRPIRSPADAPPEPEASFGDFAPGRFAWLLTDVRPVAPPVPARGALGLWEWSPPWE